MNKNAFGNHKSSLIAIILAVAIAVSGVAVPNVAYAAETTSNTVTNDDGSVTTTTVTKNDDGTTTTVTRTEVTEGKMINYTEETVITDANGNVVSTSNKKGQKSAPINTHYEAPSDDSSINTEITDEDGNLLYSSEEYSICDIKPSFDKDSLNEYVNSSIDLFSPNLVYLVKELPKEYDEDTDGYVNDKSNLYCEYKFYNNKNKLIATKKAAYTKELKAKVKNAYYVKARLFIENKNLYSEWSDKFYLIYSSSIKKNKKTRKNGRHYIEFAKGSQNIKYLFYIKKGKKYKKLATGYSKNGKLNLSYKLPRNKWFKYKIVAKYKVNDSYKTKTIFKGRHKIDVFIIAKD